ncbi:MAG: hypothetical protein PHU04_05355 [Candidatus Peribacteraceae bacterium]|nr:hypothetical protein [Candidatus Peribacteraceae bacterium]
MTAHTTFSHFRALAHEHDSLPAFHAAYLVLILLAAAFFSLGFFALLILGHMSLDLVKYRDFHGFSWRQTCAAAFHENLMDVALLCIALVFSVYLHHSVGLIGVSGLLRTGATFLWAAGTIGPKFAILENALRMVARFQYYLDQIQPQALRGWRTADYVYASCIVLSFFLLLAAPYMTGAEPGVIRMVVLWELTPWNL